MKTFVLRLQDATHGEEFSDVTCFAGEDSSGSFSILANHARFITALTIGLGRFRLGDEHWKYLAVPGAVLYFDRNVLTLSTRRYLLDDNCLKVSDALEQQLLSEEEKLHGMKESLHRMEDEFLKRMWELSRRGGPGL